MLRSIQTEAALTVLPPPGVGAPFAIQRESSIYGQAVNILRSPLSPSETWAALQQLVRNPWEGLAAWFSEKNLSFTKKEGNTFSLNGMVVPDNYWLPFFQQCLQRKHCAATASLALARLGAGYIPSRPCAFVVAEGGIDLLTVAGVYSGTRMGATIYGPGDGGSHEVLIQYNDYSVSAGGAQIGFQGGVVKSLVDETTGDLLKEPLLAAAGFTFQCEMFHKEKWYTDDGFQTLRGAQKRLEEMVKEGQTARVMNALTKQFITV